MKNKIAVLGCNGYVGSSLCNLLLNDNRFILYPINRENFKDFEEVNFDFVINASMPSRRYIAEKYPEKDFVESVDKTKYFLSKYKYDKFINISSFSVRTSPRSFYGGNRKIVEDLVFKKGGSNVRLGPMYSGIIRKSTLNDIVNGVDIKYSSDTKYSYCDVNWNSKYIIENIDAIKDLIEIGARDHISLGDLAKQIGSSSNFGDINDDQYCIDFSYGPTSKMVVEYVFRCQKNGVYCG